MTDDRTAHAHRLGPFHTDADPSVHDEAISALVGAYFERCETCTVLQTPGFAANTPALVRMLEVVGRSHTARGGSLRDLASNAHEWIGWIADLADAKPKRRAVVLDDIVAEGRTQITTAAAQLLVGVWVLEKMQADAPAHAAAEARRVTERYGLTGPPAGGESEWAWAVFHTARRAWENMPAGSYTTQYTLHIAATADPADEDYLLGPLALDRGYAERSDAELVLKVEGWAPVWDNGKWEDVDPASLQQGNFTWPDGRPWDRPDDRSIIRIRRPAIDTTGLEKVPYAKDFRWTLGCDCYWDYDDPFGGDGPPPGRVRSAVRTLAIEEAGDDALLYFTDPVEAERFRVEQLAEAHETIAKYRAWLRGQVRAHGWPRAGVDWRETARLVLAWVATDPDADAKAQGVAVLREAVAAGLADPDHLMALEGGVELPLSSLVERAHTHCRTAFPQRPAAAAQASTVP